MKNILLRPLSWFYQSVTDCRNQAYDKGLLLTEKLPVPVIAVGNLTMGGTGKTPLIGELVQWALDNKISVGIVSRGYKGSYKGVVKVAGSLDPAVFGDEPVMLAHRFPNVPIYLSGKKVLAASQMLAAEKVQLILADDAFQHRQLQRDLDILVMDATESVENYTVVPAGRGREKLSHLQRAHYIILNKINLVSPEQKQKVLDLIEDCSRGRTIPVIECEYYIPRLRHLSDGRTREGGDSTKVALVSGIGNPAAFETLMRKSYDVRTHFIYPDHMDFKKSDCEKIVIKAKELSATVVLTEKDAVKWRSLGRPFNLEFDVWVAELKPKLSLKVKELYERIHHLLR